MPVFDIAERMINPDHFSEKLIGAICEITFTLKHFAINAHTKPNGNVIEANDVFSAHVENIAILKNPPTIPRSPYKGRSNKKPHHCAQVANKKEEIDPAAAFEHTFTRQTFDSPVPSGYNDTFSPNPTIKSLVYSDSASYGNTAHTTETPAPASSTSSEFPSGKSTETAVSTQNSPSSSSNTSKSSQGIFFI